MRWTRLSFYYLITYLSLGGLGFLIDPERTLRLLAGESASPWLIVRLLGMMMIGLAIIVFEIAGRRVEPMYRTTLLVRAVFLAIMVGLYIAYSEPMVLVLLGIVGLGVALTIAGWCSDRRARARP